MPKDIRPILGNYNELIDLLSTMNKLNSAVSAAGSGDNTDSASYEHLLATQSILSLALKDACEWVRS